jgi:hypothetical protein
MATYSFMDVACTIVGPGGAVSLGYGAGVSDEGITVEYAEDKDMMVIGADATPMHSLRADKSGTCTVRLLKTSPTNGLLQAMYLFQTLSSANWGNNTLVVSDVARGDLASCRSVAFKKVTGLTWAKDANMNEWAFNCGLIDFIIGIAP